MDEVARHKPKRGRPKNRVVQHCSKPSIHFPTSQSAQNIKKKNKHLIRATASPIPGHFKEKPHLLNIEGTNPGFTTIICDDQEQGGILQDEEWDENDILQEILTSGILDWNPEVSWAANHIKDDGLNGDEETDKITIDEHVMGEEFVDANYDVLSIEKGALEKHLSSTKRHRGRPKKSTHDMNNESSSIFLELDNENNENIQCMRSWSLAQSTGRVVDDEYRPSPSLLATVRSPSVEVKTHAIAELTVEEITSRMMAQPLFWTSVWNNWSTLELDQWLDATVANFYLAHMWYEVHDTSCMRYVNIYTARMNPITAEEKELFKRNYFLPREGRCPMVPVGFIVHHSQHFFVVIFDYQRQRARILGCHISEDAMNVDGVDPHDWEDWGGPEYWTRIGDLHEWSLGDVSDVSVITKDWVQNGLDCGPIACSVLEQCLASGINEGGHLPVFEVQCGHLLRIIAGHVKLSCSDYLMLLDSSQDDWREEELPDEDLINDIQNGRHQAKCLQLLRRLGELKVERPTPKPNA
ncbi:uncharacterized protein F5147DRAFT_773848 [Suillus discolor]|uniref:Ubiquitin-like protease family profile domain-containing protein n=1 Tax=Suillus discolor TaxID=1912936 RepID=A0A9P7F5Y9_9AGAM|nr:uncharacterized protein F5147DRAFT_773848 [Suillus discolor]KAG2108265.1 hypothetical protein F5147DRAFT_773848 [Suillus discolor]